MANSLQLCATSALERVSRAKLKIKTLRHLHLLVVVSLQLPVVRLRRLHIQIQSTNFSFIISSIKEPSVFINCLFPNCIQL